MSGTLYLLPCDLGPARPGACLPEDTRARLLSLARFIAEEPRTARRFLASLGRTGLRALTFDTLDEHTPKQALDALLAPLREGEDVGLLSEAGCPAVADPGADLVALAHREGIRVVPMVGPSAILLALMASGLGGQRFAFHGYLPVNAAERGLALRELEAESARAGVTQLFIETPYRNDALLADLLAHCAAETMVCIASDLTQTEEQVATRSVAQWRLSAPALDRRPTVFALRAAGRLSATRGRSPGPASPPQPGSPRSAGRRVRRGSASA